MKDEVLLQIDKIIEIIYSVDKIGIDNAFLVLIDMLVAAVNEEQIAENSSLNVILSNLQEAYERRDLVDLADVLLYQLKIFFEPTTIVS